MYRSWDRLQRFGTCSYGIFWFYCCCCTLLQRWRILVFLTRNLQAFAQRKINDFHILTGTPSMKNVYPPDSFSVRIRLNINLRMNRSVQNKNCPVSWQGCCRIHWLLFFRGVSPPPSPVNKCPGYDTKQSDREVLVMLELRRM